MTWHLKTLKDAINTDFRLFYLIDDLLPENSLALFYGAPGSLKTMILLDMLLCCSKGLEWLGDNHNQPGIKTKQSNILWVDIDNGEDRLGSRIKALSRGNHIDSANFYYISFPDPACIIADKSIQDLIIELCIEKSINIIAFDNLLSISGEIDENSARMRAVMLALRRIIEKAKVAIIAIHHTPKIEGTENYRGHSSIGQYADLQIFIARNEDAVTLKATKERDHPVPTISALWQCKTENKALTWGKFSRLDSAYTGIEQDIIMYTIINKAVNQSQIVDYIRDKYGLGRNKIIDALKHMVTLGDLEELEGERNQKIYKYPDNDILSTFRGVIKDIWERKD